MRMWQRRVWTILALAGALAWCRPAAAVEMRIAVQPGLTYLAFMVAQSEKLIEKHAAAAGIRDLTVSFQRFGTGNSINDAVISGASDIGSTGVPAFLILWSRARSLDVRAISAYNALPLVLVTRNPAVKTIKDLGAADRIALPGVGSSTQAILLQIAASRAWGIADFKRLDPLTVSRGHPDAMAALLSPGSEINGHFSAAPFLQRELATPGVHAITSSTEIYGGPGTIGIAFTTGKYRDANPGLMKAFIAALDEAMQVIKTDKHKAARIYNEVSGDKMKEEDLVAILEDPLSVYETTPRGIETVASFMAQTGTIKTKPTSWKEVCFPEIQDRDGS